MGIVSSAKIAASKHSAKLGGVKTVRGKEIIRWNARKHGILADLKTKYEGNVLDRYLRDLRTEYQPVGVMEGFLVERIATGFLMLYRAGKAEREFMLTRLQPSRFDRLGDIHFDEDSYRPVIQYEDVERLSGIYLRYQTTIENRIYKAMHELERLQRMRSGERVESPVVVEMNDSGGFVSQNHP